MCNGEKKTKVKSEGPAVEVGLGLDVRNDALFGPSFAAALKRQQLIASQD